MEIAIIPHGLKGPPVLFLMFTDIVGYREDNVRYFYENQIGRFGKKNKKNQITIINTAIRDEVRVPWDFYGESLIVTDPNILIDAWRSATKLADLANQGQQRNIQQQKRIFRTPSLSTYEADCKEMTAGHFYPFVKIDRGFVLVLKTNHEAKRIETPIIIVPSKYRNFAEIGVGFLSKNKCSFCIFGPHWGEKDSPMNPYHLFIEDPHKDCPHRIV